MGTTSKALSLLAFFSRARPEIGLTEMTRLSGMNKATTFRLLSELAAHGFVEQFGPARAYRLGPAFLRLAALREAGVPMRDLARDVLRALSDVTGETAHMSLLRGTDLNAIAYTYASAHGTQVRMEDAEELLLHATSSGLAVLAWSGAGFVDQVLAQKLAKRTPQTLTDPDQVRARLAPIRAQGFAVSIGGFEADVHSHAVPIFNAASAPIGALAVAAPSARMTPDLAHLIQQELLEKGPHLTRLLGGFTPADFPLAHAA
ncbi:MAG TPA: IclR family transcriptional regulator [Aliiroseovarius sp.]|nr:IclR family transcriptional regulator [Aliiroseovarius sp.]